MRFGVLFATSTFHTFPILNGKGLHHICLSTNQSQPQAGAAVCLVEVDLPFESIYIFTKLKFGDQVMIKNTLLALVLVGGLAATSYAFGAFSTTPKAPCVCCGDACTCLDCLCDEEGCACDIGGRCACDEGCSSSCCCSD